MGVDIAQVRRRLAREEPVYGDPVGTMCDDLAALCDEVDRLSFAINDVADCMAMAAPDSGADQPAWFDLGYEKLQALVESLAR